MRFRCVQQQLFMIYVSNPLFHFIDLFIHCNKIYRLLHIRKRPIGINFNVFSSSFLRVISTYVGMRLFSAIQQFIPIYNWLQQHNTKFTYDTCVTRPFTIPWTFIIQPLTCRKWYKFKYIGHMIKWIWIPLHMKAMQEERFLKFEEYSVRH